MNNQAAIHVSVSSHYREASCESGVISQGILGAGGALLDPGPLFSRVSSNCFRHSDADFSSEHVDTLFIVVNRYPLPGGGP